MTSKYRKLSEMYDRVQEEYDDGIITAEERDDRQKEIINTMRFISSE